MNNFPNYGPGQLNCPPNYPPQIISLPANSVPYVPTAPPIQFVQQGSQMIDQFGNVYIPIVNPPQYPPSNYQMVPIAMPPPIPQNIQHFQPAGPPMPPIQPVMQGPSGTNAPPINTNQSYTAPTGQQPPRNGPKQYYPRDKTNTGYNGRFQNNYTNFNNKTAPHSMDRQNENYPPKSVYLNQGRSTASNNLRSDGSIGVFDFREMPPESYGKKPRPLAKFAPPPLMKQTPMLPVHYFNAPPQPIQPQSSSMRPYAPQPVVVPPPPPPPQLQQFIQHEQDIRNSPSAETIHSRSDSAFEDACSPQTVRSGVIHTDRGEFSYVQGKGKEYIVHSENGDSFHVYENPELAIARTVSQMNASDKQLWQNNMQNKVEELEKQISYLNTKVDHNKEEITTRFTETIAIAVEKNPQTSCCTQPHAPVDTVTTTQTTISCRKEEVMAGTDLTIVKLHTAPETVKLTTEVVSQTSTTEKEAEDENARRKEKEELLKRQKVEKDREMQLLKEKKKAEEEQKRLQLEAEKQQRIAEKAEKAARAAELQAQKEIEEQEKLKADKQRAKEKQKEKKARQNQNRKTRKAMMEQKEAEENTLIAREMKKAEFDKTVANAEKEERKKELKEMLDEKRRLDDENLAKLLEAKKAEENSDEGKARLVRQQIEQQLAVHQWIKAQEEMIKNPVSTVRKPKTKTFKKPLDPPPKPSIHPEDPTHSRRASIIGEERQTTPLTVVTDMEDDYGNFLGEEEEPYNEVDWLGLSPVEAEEAARKRAEMNSNPGAENIVNVTDES